MDQESGERLRRFIDDRMAERNIESLVQLADRAPVTRGTLYDWFRGHEPSPAAGGRVARVLGITYRDLLDAYEGSAAVRDGPPADLLVALGAQTEAINRLADSLAPLSDLPDVIRELADIQAAQSTQIARNTEGVMQALAVSDVLVRREIATEPTPPLPRRTGQ